MCTYVLVVGEDANKGEMIFTHSTVAETKNMSIFVSTLFGAGTE